MRACRTSNLNTANRSIATKADVEAHFATHGTGTIKEIKLMNGFGFIEYEDAMDARDVVPGNYPAPPLHRKQTLTISTPAFRTLQRRNNLTRHSPSPNTPLWTTIP